ncbi:Uncharacterised protein [Actinobaculum suis]|uniref:Uncharacterized protein n=1 Tax=Actinobaculum suis TaxID=1657 RepID=A0A7Z9C909_9ACTO|nr:hypothetical protein [Actinobaculum suis]VDG75801.1 Uncharacterised protein [Actinobaculum suis]
MDQPHIYFTEDHRMVMYVSDVLRLIDDTEGRLSSQFAQAAMRAASGQFQTLHGRKPTMDELATTPIITAWNKEMEAKNDHRGM